MILYDPKFLDTVTFFSEEEKEELARLQGEYPLSSLADDPRVLEERTADYAYVSAKIEGNSYTRKGVANLLGYGFTEGGKPFLDAVMILNLRTAFAWVRLKAPEPEILSKDFLFGLHRIVTANLLPESMQGAIRSSPVRVGGTEYVPLEDPARLSVELDRLLSKIPWIEDPFERSVYAHLNLAYLQCFSDGNKRTARLMQTAFLVKAGITPIFLEESAIREYLNSLLVYYETGDPRPYAKLFLSQYKRTIDSSLHRTPEQLESLKREKERFEHWDKIRAARKAARSKGSGA